MKQKIVTMCQGGNSRSVACAYLLKYHYGCDALSSSWECNSPETLEMLFRWADRIVVMQEHFRSYVPQQYSAKIIVIDVGEDVWFNGLHPELIKKCNDLLTKYRVQVDG